MKERPINLKAWEVRAILDGRKTQFRRVMKPQPSEGLSWRGVISCSTMKADEGKHLFTDRYPCARQAQRIRCPYGQPGDRLWVRETSCMYPQAGDDGEAGLVYRENGRVTDGMLRALGRKRKPSIFMRRHESRITLEIERVRVERLNEISEEDAKAEGVNWKNYVFAAEAYQELWDQINGPGSWAANPWVWVVTFRRG